MCGYFVLIEAELSKRSKFPGTKTFTMLQAGKRCQVVYVGGGSIEY